MTGNLTIERSLVFLLPRFDLLTAFLTVFLRLASRLSNSYCYYYYAFSRCCYCIISYYCFCILSFFISKSFLVFLSMTGIILMMSSGCKLSSDGALSLPLLESPQFFKVTPFALISSASNYLSSPSFGFDMS